MNNHILVEKVLKIVKPIVDNFNFELYHLEFKKEGNDNYLRIYIDKEEGNISLEDCEIVSRAVSDVLDREDPIKDSYYLEVSSPGIERTLYTKEHFKRYIGFNVIVNIQGLLKGKKRYQGQLLSFDEETLRVSCEGEEIVIPKSKILTVSLKDDL
ncbi:ribosome maturation factor RimP [Clostridium sp.]|jgi:ribosome maturation factor RimP|uniref:ribosome maturation factor RimP n=1 Tax=Clostridium sp. TaxID=1506 RepID=UPI002FDEC933